MSPMSPFSRFPSFLDAVYGFGPLVDLSVKDRMTILFWYANPHFTPEKLAARLDIEPHDLSRLLNDQGGRRVIDWLLVNYGPNDLPEYRLSAEEGENPMGVILPPLRLLSEDQRIEQLRAEGEKALAKIGFCTPTDSD